MGCHGMGWRIDIPSSKLLHINLTGHKFQVIFFFLRLERRTGISSRHHHHRLPIYYAYTYGTIKSRSCSSNYHLNMVLAAINCQRASDRRLNLRSRRRFPISFEFALVFHDHPSIHPSRSNCFSNANLCNSRKIYPHFFIPVQNHSVRL